MGGRGEGMTSRQHEYANADRKLYSTENAFETTRFSTINFKSEAISFSFFHFNTNNKWKPG